MLRCVGKNFPTLGLGEGSSGTYLIALKGVGVDFPINHRKGTKPNLVHDP